MNINKETKRLIDAYNLVVSGIENKAEGNDERAYGGIIRAGKGILVENLCKKIVLIAWQNIGGKPDRISFQKESVRIKVNPAYIKKIKSSEVRKYVRAHLNAFHYNAKTDIHITIDGKFVMGIECKAYTENAMLKRILVDFTLLKQANKNLECVLFQLESQLGGDYGKIAQPIIYGSGSTHTLMSYFDVDLSIVTLLEGERKVDRPIHKKEFVKVLSRNSLDKAVNFFSDKLKKYL